MAALLPVNDAAVYTAINNYEKYFTNLQQKTDMLAQRILILKEREESVATADYVDLKGAVATDFVAAGLMCYRDLLQKKQSGRPDEAKTQELFSHLQNAKDRINGICLTMINDAEGDCKRKLQSLKEPGKSISSVDQLEVQMLLNRQQQFVDMSSYLINKISTLHEKMLETL